MWISWDVSVCHPMSSTPDDIISSLWQIRNNLRHHKYRNVNKIRFYLVIIVAISSWNLAGADSMQKVVISKYWSRYFKHFFEPQHWGLDGIDDCSRHLLSETGVWHSEWWWFTKYFAWWTLHCTSILLQIIPNTNSKWKLSFIFNCF